MTANEWTASRDLKAAVELINPEMAEHWLKALNVHNRPMKSSLIEKLERDMKSQNFKTNGEPIIFASNGQLMDGQNRLQAIVNTGLAQEILVVRNIPAEFFCTIDAGIQRRLADYLAIDCQGNVQILQAALFTAVMINKGQHAASNSNRPTTSECFEFLHDNPDIKHQAQRVQNEGKTIAPPGLIAGILLFLNRTNTALASQWFEALLRPDADLVIEQDNFKLMRAELRKNVRTKKKLRRRDLWCVLILPWNATIAEKRLSSIHYPAKGETIPTLTKAAPLEDRPEETNMIAAPAIV